MAESLSKGDVLARIAEIQSCISDPLACPHEMCRAGLAAIAAAVAGWCVVEGGHRFSLYDGLCNNCGQRRDEEGA